MSNYDFKQLAYVEGMPSCTGQMKFLPSDFKVIEEIDYPLSGDGEHLWLWVEKVGLNTDHVAQSLAKHAQVGARAVGYAGKKDRHAVTQQWFSIHLPGKQTPNVQHWKIPGVQILKAIRHQRKLQTGGLSGNRFELVVRHLRGDLQDIKIRCERIQKQGVPNYFGLQRFGQEMGNLLQAEALFSGKLKRVSRNQKGLLLSAVRSWVFNQILSQRISQQTWRKALLGDYLMLSGSQRCFGTEGEDLNDLNLRVESGDISPTGLLPGLGVFKTAAGVAVLEETVVNQFANWQMGLEEQGVKQSRRALILRPQHFEYHLSEQDKEVRLQLKFSLPAGAYATMVVRECLTESEL